MKNFYGATERNGWSLVYKKAIEKDGTLLFPQKLNAESLDKLRRSMGSYLFANQYLNEVIPEDSMNFKPEWIRYYSVIPKGTFTFCFIDPALSEADTADYTGILIVDVDYEGTWYIRVAKRQRLTPTDLIKMIFEINDKFKPMVIGVESVAYQKAILYFLSEEMRRRKTTIPVTGINPGNSQSKETRILGLVPRFEWGRILLSQGLTNIEDELLSFPRGAHDDLIDALASIEQIAIIPSKDNTDDKAPPQNHPDYERWFIEQLRKGKSPDEINQRQRDKTEY